MSVFVVYFEKELIVVLRVIDWLSDITSRPLAVQINDRKGNLMEMSEHRKVSPQKLVAEAGGVRMLVYGTILIIVLAQGMIEHGISGDHAVLYALLMVVGFAALIVGLTYLNLRRGHDE
jgi:hypothetical protein